MVNIWNDTNNALICVCCVESYLLTCTNLIWLNIMRRLAAKYAGFDFDMGLEWTALQPAFKYTACACFNSCDRSLIVLHQLVMGKVRFKDVGGCTGKQPTYRCYHRLISWRATFSYCQMCWLHVRIATKWLKLESRGFHYKVELYHSYLLIKFDDDIQGGFLIWGSQNSVDSLQLRGTIS